MLSHVLDLFFPKVCEACSNLLNDGECIVCTSCRHELPVTNFHMNHTDTVKKILYGRVRLEHATALLHFSKKGLVQQLMHRLKYKGHEHIGLFFGDWLGFELAQTETFKTVDVVIPVPLHKKRFRERGYNQVTKFGKAIAKALNADFVDDVLLKSKITKTQVFKNRLKRISSSESSFILSDFELLTGKHILLVDDIITTGATIEDCASTLIQIPNVKLSLASMAIVD